MWFNAIKQKESCYRVHSGTALIRLMGGVIRSPEVAERTFKITKPWLWNVYNWTNARAIQLCSSSILRAFGARSDRSAQGCLLNAFQIALNELPNGNLCTQIVLNVQSAIAERIHSCVELRRTVWSPLHLASFKWRDSYCKLTSLIMHRATIASRQNYTHSTAVAYGTWCARYISSFTHNYIR